jgi:hypothetical protein
MAMRTGKFIVPATALIEKLTGTAGAHLPRIRGNRTGRYAGEMANLEAVEGRAYGVYQHRLDLLLGRSNRVGDEAGFVPCDRLLSARVYAGGDVPAVEEKQPGDAGWPGFFETALSYSDEPQNRL